MRDDHFRGQLGRDGVQMAMNYKRYYLNMKRLLPPLMISSFAMGLLVALMVYR